MKTLFILNDPPYGTERCYNALRLASALLKNDLESGLRRRGGQAHDGRVSMAVSPRRRDRDAPPVPSPPP